MTNSRFYQTTANLMLFAFILLSGVADAIFKYYVGESPAGFDTLQSFATLYVLGYWLHADNRRHKFKWPYCQGVFVYVAGFIIIPYYLFKTRGARAFITLSIFVGMHVISMLIGFLAGTLLIGPAFY